MHVLPACSAPPLQPPDESFKCTGWVPAVPHSAAARRHAQLSRLHEGILRSAVQPCARLQVNKVSEVVTSLADPSANVIFGAVIDDQYEGEIHVTIIATGFSQNYEEAVLTGKAMDVPPTPSTTSNSGSLPWNRRSGTFRQTLLS